MSFAQKVSGKNRERKFRHFLNTFSPDENTSILDIGFSNVEYSPHDNYLEKHYPYQHRITALGIEPHDLLSARYPKIKAVTYDGLNMPFEDKTFDIAWSNAVIEHVGGWDRQVLFLKEIHRVSRKAYITTPNKYFPIEVHTRTPLLHYLPKSIFDRYLRLTGQKWAAGNYMSLLSYGDLVKQLKEAGITKYKIRRNRLFFLTLDFVITFE